MTKRHLELKINYLRYRLSIIPHGFFGNYYGNAVVYVFYDPDDASISRCNKKRDISVQVNVGRKQPSRSKNMLN